MPLVNRQMQIPNGFQFYIPATKWRSTPWSSFDRIVEGALDNLRGNPSAAQKMGWPVDREFIERQVDEFNAKICEQMGWRDYYVADGGATVSVPFSSSPQEQNRITVAAVSIKSIWSGVRTLNDWLDSNDPPVPPDQSALRAHTCAVCPKNGKGDFTTWFTKPASEAIRRQLERVKDRSLNTPSDDRLNVCDVCLCPLKLKVHTPLKYIKDHLSNEVANQLRAVPNCWIIKELDS